MSFGATRGHDGGPEPLVIPGWLNRALGQLGGNFQWPAQWGDFRLTEVHERSRSRATLYRFRGRDGVEIMVKTALGWSAHHARSSYESFAHLRRVVEGIPGSFSVETLGWTATPPLVVTRFVESSDLRSLIKSVVDVEELVPQVVTVGRMLRAFHRDTNIDDEAGLRLAHQDAMSVASRIPRGRARLNQILSASQQTAAASFGDLTPGNVLCDRKGRLALIDPPLERTPVLVERDLANFLFEMRKHRRAAFGTKAVARDHPRLSAALLEGYDHQEIAADSPMVALFEFRRAAGVARKRLRARSPESLWFASQAVARASNFLMNG